MGQQSAGNKATIEFKCVFLDIFRFQQRLQLHADRKCLFNFSLFTRFLSRALPAAALQLQRPLASLEWQISSVTRERIFHLPIIHSFICFSSIQLPRVSPVSHIPLNPLELRALSSTNSSNRISTSF